VAVDVKGRGQRLLARLAKSVSREQLRSHPDVGEYLEFGAPEQLSLPLPTAVETSNAEWVRHNLALWKLSWPAPFVCVVNDARLLGSLYLGITSRGEVILETTRTAGSPDLLWPKITRHTLRNMLSLATTSQPPWAADPIAPLFHVSQDSYFHWFSDVLPAIEAVRHLESASGLRVKFLVSRPLRPWQKDTLALLGVSEPDIVCWDGSCVRVPRLVVSSVRTDGWTCLPSIASLRWIRTEMLRTAVPDAATPPYIYIRRTGRRKISNEEEMTAFMESRGIVPLDMEGIPIVSQIQMFKQARLIVGSHGAGLTNLIFCDRAEVVELFGPWKSLCFAAIARGFGHGYAAVDLLPEVGFQDGDLGRAADFHADLSRVRPAVDRAIERACLS
jgi:hypothetical protein